MDWNWFFSAVAQSTAAIVGIFGAFIFTKIINNQNEFQRQKLSLRKLSDDSEYYKDKVNKQFFVWYLIEFIKKNLGIIEKATTQDDLIGVYKRLKKRTDFPVYFNKSVILDVINARIDNPRANIVEIVKNQLNISHTINSPYFKDVHGSVDEFLFLKEKEEIDNLVTDVKHHIRKIMSFLEEIKTVPLSSPLINWSIIISIILFFVGVIYPLSFLPLEVKTVPQFSISITALFNVLLSIKGLILFFVFLIYLIIMLKFRSINNKMVHGRKDIEKITQYVKYANYSEYLQGLDENI